METEGITGSATVVLGKARSGAKDVTRFEGRPCDTMQLYPVQIVHRGSTASPAAAAPGARQP